MKGGYVELSVYLACLRSILKFYANFVVFYGFLAHWILLLIVTCVLFGILLRFRIPKPKNSTFRNIFGQDWGAYLSSAEEEKIQEDYFMKVVAHRACGLDAPENSLSALDKASREGITAVEFDVLVTADGIPVVFHDTNLLRMTNVNKYVAETTYEEIKHLDISLKHPFGKNFRGEKIPLLDDYVSYCLNNDIRMFIDLKYSDNAIVQIIVNLFAEYPKLYDLSVVSSFNPILIYKIRAKDPKIACSLAWRPYFYSHEDYSDSDGPSSPRNNNLLILMCLRILNDFHQWALWNFGYYLLGLSALLLHKDMITREIIQYWKKRGIRVIAWSVNLPTEKQYFEKILQITYLTDTVINN